MYYVIDQTRKTVFDRVLNTEKRVEKNATRCGVFLTTFKDQDLKAGKGF